VFAELLSGRLRGVAELSAEQACALSRHYELLVRWNKVMNLTSVRNLEETVERHYCESVFLAARLPAGALAIADIGSGAGFPGIPVAVMRPECQVTLIESHQRKAVFLREASREMPNVRVAPRRAEDVEGAFDWAVSRAVRAADIGPVLARMASQVALLAGGEKPEAAGVEWAAPIQLPWGERRFLWLGRSVSRGT
jgi:16S rRNA (guanine527-N7)-methyltransferase